MLPGLSDRSFRIFLRLCSDPVSDSALSTVAPEPEFEVPLASEGLFIADKLDDEVDDAPPVVGCSGATGGVMDGLVIDGWL